MGPETCFDSQKVLTLLVQGDTSVLHMFQKNLPNFG